ncbi:MAG: hypothetical protein ACO263_11725 [Cyclobacteriaceae bacterium]|jgi:hypothetical protein
MKNLRISLLLAIMTLVFYAANAQQSEKELKKDISEKATREARREAKEFEKKGYSVAPGALPMEKQIERAWMRQYETDDTGYPLYIVASGNSVANSQSAAKLQATEIAKLELAGSISTQVAALIETSIANEQLSAKDAASVTKTVAAAKNIIAQEIGRVIPLFEIYKTVGKNIESNVRVAYNSQMAMESAKKVIKKKLEEETEIAHEKLEKLMNFN